MILGMLCLRYFTNAVVLIVCYAAAPSNYLHFCDYLGGYRCCPLLKIRVR